MIDQSPEYTVLTTCCDDRLLHRLAKASQVTLACSQLRHHWPPGCVCVRTLIRRLSLVRWVSISVATRRRQKASLAGNKNAYDQTSICLTTTLGACGVRVWDCFKYQNLAFSSWKKNQENTFAVIKYSQKRYSKKFNFRNKNSTIMNQI